MQISKKKIYKILACAMSAIFVSTINGGVASAEDEPQSDNEVTMTEDSITVNGKTTNYGTIIGNVLAGRTGNEYTGSGGYTGLVGNEFFTGGILETGNVHGNTMTVRNADLNNWEIIVAGSTVGNVFNNVSNFYDVKNVAFIDGGFAYGGDGDVYSNIINFYSGTVGGLHGGHSNNGDAYENVVNIFGGTIGQAGGGYSNYGNVKNNHLNIFDGVINGDVYGGYASYNGGTSGDAIGNTVTINGGTINGDVYGGRAPNGNATDNEINIYGNPNLTDANLYAGRGVSAAAVSGNNLNIYTKGSGENGLEVNNIGGFENLNFILPANTENGNTILTINSPAADTPLSNNINVSSNGSSNLTTGNIVTLITTPSPSGLILGKYDNDNTLSVGISLDYALTLEEIKSGSITTGFKATVGELKTTTLKEQTELLTAPVVDSASLLDSGTDRLSEWLPPEGLDYMNSSPTAGFDPFVGIGGSTLKINTGNGTELKTKSGGINFGMTRYLKNRHGVFIVAPIVDYGRDAYDSVLPDANGTRGSGHSQYFMGGLIARQANVNGMYYEGSFRYGKIRTDFISHNFLVHGNPTTASYEASTPCYAGHVRIGWRNHISPQNILDIYGLYSFNRISGFTTKVSTGEDYSFSAVNSGRIRVGARFTRELKERENVYSSIAYIHEFSGETVGEYMGMITPRASLKGSAGLIELGWQVKPAKNSVAMLDTSLSWWIGDRKGVTFAMKFKKDF